MDNGQMNSAVSQFGSKSILFLSHGLQSRWANAICGTRQKSKAQNSLQVMNYLQ
jgi:hypothetical protein